MVIGLFFFLSYFFCNIFCLNLPDVCVCGDVWGGGGGGGGKDVVEYNNII